MAALTSLGVYIHIPICQSLCSYCDFYSIESASINRDFWEEYYQKIIQEFQFKLPHLQDDYILNSIYFGGGTPSLAPPPFIEKIISFLLDNLPRKSRKIEITIEANPETVTAPAIRDFSSAGINRISMGVQSLNDQLLRLLGRISNRNIILKAMETLNKSSIVNWSADLIYGIPGQKEADILDSLETLLQHEPRHISAYALTLDNHRLVNDFTGYKGKKISDTRQYSHQKLIWGYLPDHGFTHYEISNFAHKGFECLHNLAVWKYRPYLSLGTSGHSFLNHFRYRTVSDIKRYLRDPMENSVFKEKAKVVPDLLITILRLKSRQGNALFRKLLNAKEYGHFENQLSLFYNNQWIKPENNGFIITEEGLNFSNTMLERLYDNLAEVLG